MASTTGALMSVHKGLGSYVHVCPRPCSSTNRWAKLATHLRKDHTQCYLHSHHCEVWVLTPLVPVQPWHVCHRQKTGLPPMACRRSRTWSLLARLPRLGRTCSSGWDCSRQKPVFKQVAITCRSVNAVLRRAHTPLPLHRHTHPNARPISSPSTTL